MRRIIPSIYNIYNYLNRIFFDYFGAIFIYKFKKLKNTTDTCEIVDLPYVIEIYKENFGGGAEKNIKRYQKIFRNIFYIKKDEQNKITGYCIYYVHIKINKLNFYKVATLYSIAVDQKNTLKGIGSILLKDSISELCENNIKKIELYVNTNNIPGLLLYKKFGFKEIYVIDNICGQGNKCIKMELLLN